MTAAEDVAATVQQALADWLADNGGGFVTSFAFSLEYIDEDGDRAWALATMENQSPSQTLGLLRWHTIDIEQQCADYLRGDGEVLVVTHRH